MRTIDKIIERKVMEILRDTYAVDTNNLNRKDLNRLAEEVARKFRLNKKESFLLVKVTLRKVRVKV